MSKGFRVRGSGIVSGGLGVLALLMRKLGIVGIPVIGWALFSCVGEPTIGDLPEDDGAVGGISEVPNPSPQMARESGTPLPTLQRGHEVYMLKCGECHSYMIPDDLFQDEWEDAVPKMIRHAGLGSEEEQAVLAYVIAVKKEE